MPPIDSLQFYWQSQELRVSASYSMSPAKYPHQATPWALLESIQVGTLYFLLPITHWALFRRALRRTAHQSSPPWMQPDGGSTRCREHSRPSSGPGRRALCFEASRHWRCIQSWPWQKTAWLPRACSYTSLVNLGFHLRSHRADLDIGPAYLKGA